MIEYLSGIIENSADWCGSYDVGQFFGFKFCSGYQVVQVVDVGLLVFSVLEVVGLPTDDWLQCLVGVRNHRHFVFHNDIDIKLLYMLFNVYASEKFKLN